MLRSKPGLRSWARKLRGGGPDSAAVGQAGGLAAAADKWHPSRHAARLAANYVHTPHRLTGRRAVRRSPAGTREAAGAAATRPLVLQPDRCLAAVAPKVEQATTPRVPILQGMGAGLELEAGGRERTGPPEANPGWEPASQRMSDGSHQTTKVQVLQGWAQERAPTIGPRPQTVELATGRQPAHPAALLHVISASQSQGERKPVIGAALHCRCSRELQAELATVIVDLYQMSRELKRH